MAVSLSVSPLARRLSLVIIAATACVLLSVGAFFAFRPDKHNAHDLKSIIIEWHAFFLELDRFTEGYRPPISARAMAYMEMAAYESGRKECHAQKSLIHFFSDMALPQRPQQQDFSPELALNAAYAQITRLLFPHAPAALRVELDQKEKRIAANWQNKPSAISINYGQSVANAIFKWSATDSAGHEAFRAPYATDYHADKSKPAVWAPSGRFLMPPLLPNWGKVRPLLIRLEDIEIREPSVYSAHHNSDMYKQALEVYSLSRQLTSEDHWLAEYWSDDHPGLTFTPVSRWLSISNQLIQSRQMEPCLLLEYDLKLALSLHNAAVLCWKTKYEKMTPRPSAYIRAHIDRDWQPYLNDPSFPSYPSGHAIFGAAAVEIFDAYFPNYGSFRDNSHEGRTEFNGQTRLYANFKEMAQENAYSRILGGIHYRMDCDEGLRLGELIGKQVLGLSFSISQYSDNT